MPFTNPQKNIERFEILPGFQVADLGAGSGAYTLGAAKLVGENGRVYAIDIQKELLATIKKEAERQHVSNVELVWGDVEKSGGTRLRDASIDTVIVSNLLFQIEDKDTFVSEIKRILKPEKGTVCVIDWLDSFGGLGPEPAVVITLAGAKEIFLRHGFSLYRTLSDVGAHHYGVIFKR